MLSNSPSLVGNSALSKDFALIVPGDFPVEMSNFDLKRDMIWTDWVVVKLDTLS